MIIAWVLYKRDEILRGVPEKSLKYLKMFSFEIANALIYAMMPASRNRPSKRKSSQAVKPPLCSKLMPNPVDDVQYNNIGHWPVPVSDKKRGRLCQSYA